MYTVVGCTLVYPSTLVGTLLLDVRGAWVPTRLDVILIPSYDNIQFHPAFSPTIPLNMKYYGVICYCCLALVVHLMI